MYKEKIINPLTGEETWRDYSADEIAEVEKAQAEATIKIQAEQEAFEAAEAKKQAVAEKLGLSIDEIKALLA